VLWVWINELPLRNSDEELTPKPQVWINGSLLEQVWLDESGRERWRERARQRARVRERALMGTAPERNKSKVLERVFNACCDCVRELNDVCKMCLQAPEPAQTLIPRPQGLGLRCRVLRGLEHPETLTLEPN
jgi:hypothetical protein